MPERAERGLRRAAVLAVAMLALEAIALVALAIDVRAVVVGILACAGLACSAFYGAYEGFDAILRRPRSRAWFDARRENATSRDGRTRR